MCGKSRASARVRVKHTANQIDDTNADKKDALRATLSSVATRRGISSSFRGRVRMMGKKCTYSTY